MKGWLDFQQDNHSQLVWLHKMRKSFKFELNNWKKNFIWKRIDWKTQWQRKICSLKNEKITENVYDIKFYYMIWSSGRKNMKSFLNEFTLLWQYAHELITDSRSSWLEVLLTDVDVY